MRFNFTSKIFWKTFINKFGAAPLRFLCGWKHAGSILLNRQEKGSFPGEEADIILAIPNEDVLKSFDPYNGEWPRSIPPGICTNIINKLAVAHEDTSICISLDGKKVVPGLTGDKGDINLLGKESEIGCLSPAVQKQQHQQEVQSVETIKKLSADTESTANKVNTSIILEHLRSLLTMLSKKKADTRDTLEKKNYALEKLKARAAVDQTSTKYQYPISLVMANILELKESNAIGDRLRDSIAEMCAALFSDRNTWTTMATIPIDHCGRYHALHDIDLFLGCGEEPLEKFAEYVIDQGLPFIKQRSSLWFQARKQVRVTASTLYNAVGCAGLKGQREHYQQAVLGFERPPPDTSVQEAMDWGTKHEVCSLATLASKVLPALYPECCLVEVVAFPIRVGNVDMIISPDGFIHNNLNHNDIAAVECKCPKSGRVPNSIPSRYYLQVQAHIRCKPGIQWCLFRVWTEQTTKVFRVEKDDEIWSFVQQELNHIYGGDVTRCPTKLSITAREIRKMIKKNSQEYCSVIAELSSVHSCCFKDNAVTISEENLNPYTTDVIHGNFVTCSTPKMQDLPLLKLEDTLDEVVCYLKKHYLLSRKKATEVIAFVACNTDRLWSSALTHGTPICYFLKGYSLPTSVVRSILEDVLNYCHSQGIHCPVQSFDGQYLPLLQTSNNGNPQTILELQKAFWKEVCRKTKIEIVSEMKSINTITNIEDVFEKTAGVIRVSQGNKLPQTAFACLKLHVTQSHDHKLSVHPVPVEEVGSTDVQQIMEEIPECVISLGDNNDLEMGSETNQQQEEYVQNENDQGSAQGEAAVQEGIEGDVNNSELASDIQSAQNLPSSHSMGSDTEEDSLLSETDAHNILTLLKDQTLKWSCKDVDDLKQQIQNCQSLCKMTIPELKVVLKYLKDHKHQSVTMTGRKECLVGSLKNVLHLPGDIDTLTGSKSPPSLSVQCVRILCSKMYPKQALCVSYANWKFPEKVENWKNESRIKHSMLIPEIDERMPINWFYIPEYSTDRDDLLVRKIDPHHLLTRHRSALCKRNIGDAERKHFLEVAADNTTSLKLGMLQESLDMQCTDFSLITFSEEVQTQLEHKGYSASARWCKLVREWFHSMDEPGIPAVEKFKMKMRLV
ncbi:uncharacterized protein [Ptychodera flava]|uniref:uncharacterized protein n=1 Tax=Ptychodera flava TaxID=63121 RepID=UPI00396A9A1B